ncbi:MAG TPA: hypothetical protein VGJ60_06830 [Chloroflexota bacterium]|jgi:hypothetical protein
MTPTPPETAEIGEWVSVKDAAARLHITERSVFRRLEKGVLKKRANPDGSIMVLLTGQDAVIAEDMTESEPASQPGPEPQVALALGVMHSLQTFGLTRERELAERDERIASMAEEIGRLREQLAWLRRPLWKRLTGQLPS